MTCSLAGLVGEISLSPVLNIGVVALCCYVPLCMCSLLDFPNVFGLKRILRLHDDTGNGPSTVLPLLALSARTSAPLTPALPPGLFRLVDKLPDIPPMVFSFHSTGAV